MRTHLPRRPAPGDTIAVIAPASAPREPGHLSAGVANLERLGFRVDTGRASYDPTGYLAGSDVDRVNELNAVLRRTDVDVVLCVRGGYGSLRILRDLDYAAARAHPKLLVGYSDITALHMALYRHAGLPGLAGPMVASDFHEPDSETIASFQNILSGSVPIDLSGPAGEPLVPVRPGRAEGLLLGGNLTLLARLVGTPFLPNLEGAILFFEEIGEEPYRLDGLLAQLQLSGILERLGGVVIGAITEWEPKHTRPTLSVEDVLDHYLGQLACPVARGLLFGHMRRKIAVPVGVRSRLVVEGNTATLTSLEPVFGS